MTDIPRLIEKLEAATEGSIGLDVEVLHACGYGNSAQYPTSGNGWKGEIPGWVKPTRSFDDAVRLLKSTQPGWVWMREYSGEIAVAAEATEWGWTSSDAKTDAINLCVAVLRSKNY